MIEYTVKVSEDGSKYWYLNDELHREDGPAIEYSSGATYWLRNGKLHREDGPAIEYSNGMGEWLLNGKLHREDGPAVEWPDGSKAWYLNDERISEEEHARRTSKTREMTVQEISELLGFNVKIVK